MQIAVVIVHYANLTAVQRCLQSLSQVRSARHTLHPVVVGNGTPPQELSQMAAQNDAVHPVQLPTNTGFTGGNNAGMRYALDVLHADAVLLLNDDTTVAPDFLDPLVAGLEADQVAAATPSIYFSPGREFHQIYQPKERGRVLWYAGGLIDWRELVTWHRGVDQVDRGQYTRTESVPFGTGCCLLIKAEVLRRYGLFDDRLFLYWEDVDLSLRWRAHQLTVLVVPQSHIWHDNSGSSGSGSDLHVYYQLRNRFLIGWRYAPWRTKLFLLKQLWTLARHGSRVQRSAILDVITGRYGIRNALHHFAQH